MSCYLCGGPDGSDVRLCPACTRARIEGRGPRPPMPGEPLPEKKKLLKHALSGGAIVTAALYYVLFSGYGPGWALSKPDRVYLRCLWKAEKIGARDSASEPGDQFAASMRQAFGDNAKNAAKMMCDALKQECLQNPAGEKCRSFDQAL